MPKVVNPVLRGFHPDPSICRVGDDFYIATSTFEWFPGVAVYHSRDLVQWELAARPLSRRNQLDMAGNPPSGGIWAPCLSYADGRFWLIYTDVKEWAGSRERSNDSFKDTHNYLVTAESIDGPWSDPLYMNSSGFDPSLFHDDDGRKWFVNMLWDYRPGHNSFAGIVLQEFSPAEKKLVGPVKNIFQGTELGFTEAPHLYKRNGWYYLMTAEGGTSYEHAVTLARSRTVDGPYELHPETPFLSSVKDHAKFRQALREEGFERAKRFLYPGLQKAGHASMVPWEGDEWVLAHLCGRPLGEGSSCPLGRETALQRIVWADDGWPYLDAGGPKTVADFSDRQTAAESRPQKAESVQPVVWREDFDGSSWDPALMTLRLPVNADYDLSARPGWLRLYGAESPVSRFRQSLLARRVQAFSWSAETAVEFSPEDFQQMAGLMVRYDERTQAYLRISVSAGRRTLGILSYDNARIDLPLGDDEIALPDGAVYLGVDMTEGNLRFRYSTGNGSWTPVGPYFDAARFSDEYAVPMGFTGMFVGISCTDVSGRRAFADFDYLTYSERATVGFSRAR